VLKDSSIGVVRRVEEGEAALEDEENVFLIYLPILEPFCIVGIGENGYVVSIRHRIKVGFHVS
jgi:hypothetical protein